MRCNDDLSTVKSLACLLTERSGVSRIDCFTLFTFSSVGGDLGRPYLGLFIVEPASSNLRTHTLNTWSLIYVTQIISKQSNLANPDAFIGKKNQNPNIVDNQRKTDTNINNTDTSDKDISQKRVCSKDNVIINPVSTTSKENIVNNNY